MQRDATKSIPMVLSSSESNGKGPSHGNKLEATAPSSKSHGKIGMIPMVLSSESDCEGALRGKMDSGKRLLIPPTLSDSDEDVKVITERPAIPNCARKEKKPQAIKREYIPTTLSDSKVKIVAGLAHNPSRKRSPGTSKFTPMVLSSGESDHGYVSPMVMMRMKSGPAVKKEFVPKTLSDSASEGEEDDQSPAVATELKAPRDEDQEDNDAMSVDMDALVDSINNAPAYVEYNFDHIPDSMLEPEAQNDNDEDSTEGHEYGDETSEDAEYDTDEEEEEEE